MNTGVAYAKQGDLERRRHYFQKAIERGDNAAQHNLGDRAVRYKGRGKIYEREYN